MNLSCLLCYQASPTPVCHWCERDIFFFAPKDHGNNLLSYGPVGQHVKHSSYDGLSVLALHTYPITTLIHGFKFQHSLTSGKVLAQWFVGKQQHLAQHTQQISHNNAQLLLPVPLSPWRFATRHYNQAAVLANTIGNALNIPICTNWAIRKGMSAQHHLGKAQRLQHAKKVFSLTHHCIDTLISTTPNLKRIAIVDDVITTGVTVNALASLLKARYPQLHIEVWAMTFTPPPKSSLLAERMTDKMAAR
ncbi:ComF family protein [Alteromonas sp. 1_MG-2023]|uniref:ComF family protein n=1 Tax=Alteromonas sp. 1_MG-2023 TaxID=3062669 RepID=UPI0026E40BCA|nr:ComF family protein [Alteromonas sp. 1_MG-2023]MDO6566849.1 ComF family protein [Alteromonas sp. 1_MG-2023]